MASAAMLNGTAAISSNAFLSQLRLWQHATHLPAKPSYSANFDAVSGDDVGFDFDLRLDDPASMLSVDELFSDGKLVLLQLALGSIVGRNPFDSATGSMNRASGSPEVKISRPDPYIFSPCAPSFTTRWRDLLSLRRLWDQMMEVEKILATGGITTCVLIRRASNIRSLRRLLNRNSKYVPPTLLLRDSNSESTSSSRPSLPSSSSSGQDLNDLLRISLDSDSTRTK